MNAMPYEWVVCSCDSRIQGLVRVNLPKIEEQLLVQSLALTPFGEQELKADGWRRCAEGQGETQFCALLEAAVLAEREACAVLVENLRGENPDLWQVYVAAEIRERGKK
jgi:hypothetical protein